MDTKQQLFEAIDQYVESEALNNALKEAYEITVLDEGVSDLVKSGVKKLGKAVAVGAIALGATHADAAPHKHAQPAKKYTTVEQHQKNLWQDDAYQDRVNEIYEQLKQKKLAAGKKVNDAMLLEKAQDIAMTEIATGKRK